MIFPRELRVRNTSASSQQASAGKVDPKIKMSYTAEFNSLRACSLEDDVVTANP
jgi:hypothetical protein